MWTELNSTQMFVLAAAALLPAMILLIYINKKDKVDKEPASLIFKLIFFGALVAMPVAIAENFLDNALLLAFHGSWYVDNLTGTQMWNSGAYYIYELLENFFAIALVEELGKWLVMRKLTEKNYNFNCLFDGVVYGVSVSLGFAAIENVLYVISNAYTGGVSAGLNVALMRAVMSVPSHMFFGILMGYRYSFAHAKKRAGHLERYFAGQGMITVTSPFSGKNDMKKSLWIPVFVHGLYDFLLTVGLFYVAVILVIVMYFVCFGKVKQMSNLDVEEDKLAFSMLLHKYPELQQIYQSQTASV